ncbi:MAG: ABC transporter ATP-binding protein [Planctomycetota bacterium]
MIQLIHVSDFCKAYNSEIAVENLSFDVMPGQVLGIIGPNGAGKTTTLRALSALIPPTRGTLSVDGFDVVSAPVQVKRCTAYVPDDPQLFHDLTVREHFAFVASAYDVDNWQKEMKTLLDRFDLLKKLNAKASDLSRGMRQKLAICCAYLYRPSALLLDEPMTGLDPLGIRVLKKTIRERAKSGSAIMISSHLLAMVEDICSHVLILEDGRLRYNGTLEKLKQTVDNQDVTLEEIFFQQVAGLNASIQVPTC